MFKTAKTKFLAFGAAVLGSASLANAAVTFNKDTGVADGSIDLAPFLSVAAVVVVGLGTMWAIKRAIALFR